MSGLVTMGACDQWLLGPHGPILVRGASQVKSFSSLVRSSHVKSCIGFTSLYLV